MYLTLFVIVFDKVFKTVSLWKTANVIPLYKKGAKDKEENYRPVSLTSIASKICEKIVRKSIVNF